MPAPLENSPDVVRGRLLRTVVLYEDLDSVARALKVCDIIQNRPGANILLRLSMWGMRDLADCETRNLAAAAAVVADLVILSASWDRWEAPEALRQWLRLWLSLNGDSEHSLLALVPARSNRRVNNWKDWPRPEISKHPVSFAVHPVEDIARRNEADARTDEDAEADDELLWRPGELRKVGSLFPSRRPVTSLA